MEAIKKDFLMEETGPSQCGFGDFSLVGAPLWGSETLLLSFTCLPSKPHFLASGMVSGERKTAGLEAHRVINSDLQKLY